MNKELVDKHGGLLGFSDRSIELGSVYMVRLMELGVGIEKGFFYIVKKGNVWKIYNVLNCYGFPSTNDRELDSFIRSVECDFGDCDVIVFPSNIEIDSLKGQDFVAFKGLGVLEDIKSELITRFRFVRSGVDIPVPGINDKKGSEVVLQLSTLWVNCVFDYDSNLKYLCKELGNVGIGFGNPWKVAKDTPFEKVLYTAIDKRRPINVDKDINVTKISISFAC